MTMGIRDRRIRGIVRRAPQLFWTLVPTLPPVDVPLQARAESGRCAIVAFPAYHDAAQCLETLLHGQPLWKRFCIGSLTTLEASGERLVLVARQPLVAMPDGSVRVCGESLTDQTSLAATIDLMTGARP